jgi:large subunit ribosomal protein L25
MGDKVALSVEERTVLGKKVKQLRKEGKVPAIVYGQDFEATPVMVDAVVATKAWRDAGKHHVIELTVAGKKRLAMIKSADFAPVKHTLRHLSLHVVKQNEKVETEIPVRVSGEGETPAEKAGLVVLQTIEAVEVSALPNDLPDSVIVPGEQLVNAGDHVTVADIKPINGVTIMAEPEQIVATVYEPSALAAANDAAGGDATEETEVEAENGTEETPAEGEASKKEEQ